MVPLPLAILFCVGLLLLAGRRIYNAVRSVRAHNDALVALGDLGDPLPESRPPSTRPEPLPPSRSSIRIHARTQ